MSAGFAFAVTGEAGRNDSMACCAARDDLGTWSPGMDVDARSSWG